MKKVLSGIGAVMLLATSQVAVAKGDLRAAVQNPISSLISVPFKYSVDEGASNGSADILNLQPVVPVTFGDWNYVNRLIVPVINVAGDVPGQPNNPSPGSGPKVRGLGDINYSVFLSPVEVGSVIWGVGPSIMMPTANKDQLGSGKWSAGPTAVVLTQTDWGSMGLLGRQLWSFSGDKDRNKVNQTLLEPFINYNLSGGWFLISDMVITSNWEADSGNRWTVPVGAGVGRVFKIGNQPINMRFESYYNVKRPEGGPKWNSSLTFQLLFPK